MPRDAGRAYRLFRQLAVAGASRNASWQVGFCLDQGLGVARNQSAAVEWYLRAATRDDKPEAMHNLALCYMAGQGVARNLTAAAEWFSKAAQWGRDEWIEVEDGVSQLKSRGLASAQFHLGLMYLEGIGVDVDEDLGMDYLHLAGDQELRSACQKSPVV